MALVNATTGIKTPSDYAAFMEKFTLKANCPTGDILESLTFAVKDMVDIEGHVASFGNPTWLKNHVAAKSTAPSILALLNEGATCVGTVITDELASSILGKNVHYGTPKNPLVPDRVPGGSSSGSASVVAERLVDFAIATDCIGSARIPAAYCGIFGIRPSHGLVSGAGVVPLAQSLDTVGWFARDPKALSKVGRVLLKLPNLGPVKPSQIIIADDCFQLSSIPRDVLTHDITRTVRRLYGDRVIKHDNLGSYVEANVPSLKHFSTYNIPPLAAVSAAMQLLERYEFKNNHGSWINTVNPELGPGVAEMIAGVLKTTAENIDICRSVFKEFQDALTNFLGDSVVLMIPTVPGSPPTLQTQVSELTNFNERAFSLVSVAVVSGFCEASKCNNNNTWFLMILPISIPLGLYDKLPISVSLVAKHGADGFLLSLVESIRKPLGEEKGANLDA